MILIRPILICLRRTMMRPTLTQINRACPSIFHCLTNTSICNAVPTFHSAVCCNDGLGSCWLPAGLIELSAIIDNNRNSIDNFCENRSMKNHNRFTPSKKGIHWSINGTVIMGMGWGHFCFFEHFCFFFRSLALVFQKSPTRNKEATRFTLM